MTPQVTYEDEIILNSLTVENSSIGPDINVAGQPTTSIIDRKASVTMRLRDGESNLLAGLVSDNDLKNYSTLPGLSSIPVLRYIFRQWRHRAKRHQTDIVMVVTPHIVDGHHLTASDLKPMYIGTGNNLGGGTPPSLISPDIPIQQPPTLLPGAPIPTPTTAAAPPLSSTGIGSTTSSTSGAAAPSRVVPIEAVPSPVATPPAAPPAQVVVAAPSAAMQLGGPPYQRPGHDHRRLAGRHRHAHRDLQPGHVEGPGREPGHLHAAGGRHDDLRAQDR